MLRKTLVLTFAVILTAMVVSSKVQAWAAYGGARYGYYRAW